MAQPPTQPFRDQPLTTAEELPVPAIDERKHLERAYRDQIVTIVPRAPQAARDTP